MSIKQITPMSLPFDVDDKIFKCCMCEEECDCERISYNDNLEKIKSISGVNQELLGSCYPYRMTIPDYNPPFNEIAAQLRLNADILKQEISDHVDKEIERFKSEISKVYIQNLV